MQTALRHDCYLESIGPRGFRTSDPEGRSSPEGSEMPHQPKREGDPSCTRPIILGELSMPLMDVTFSQGSLNTDAQSRLSAKLWSIALRWEGIEINETSASVAWVYLDERPQHHVTVAGKSPKQNIYRSKADRQSRPRADRLNPRSRRNQGRRQRPASILYY
jgi:hypothetical protein